MSSPSNMRSLRRLNLMERIKSNLADPTIKSESMMSNQPAIQPAILIPYESSARILNYPILSSQDILLLDKYCILYWEARYLRASIRYNRDDKWIERQSTQFMIYYLDGLSDEYLERNPDHQVRLSFRRVKGRLKGIVLVSKIKGEQNESTTN